MTEEYHPIERWMQNLDEREAKEIEFACHYAELYHHGTSGHIRLMLIAKLAHLLNYYDNRDREAP